MPGALLAAAALLAGCHTQGPGRVYVWMQSSPSEVLDLDSREGTPVSVPGQIAAEARVVGMAYDYNTDFIALRLEPGSRIRLFKRGENRFVREWHLPPGGAVASRGSADLAFRPSDRHLFAAIPGSAHLLEYSVEGELLRRLELSPAPAFPLGGIAYDHVGRRLLAVLTLGNPASGEPGERELQPAIVAIDDSGAWKPLFNLPPGLQVHALGANADAGEIYLYHLDGRIAVLDFKGRQLRSLPGHMPGTVDPAQIDAGPRAFLRVF